MTEAVAMAPAPAVRRRGLLRRVIWFVAVPALAVAGIVAIVQSRRGAAAQLDKSLSAVVKRADLDVVVLETGRVEPLLQTQIKSKVGGQVTEVKVEEGQKVKKGQVLLRIDPTDYRRDVARMEAEIAQHARGGGLLASCSWTGPRRRGRCAIAPAPSWTRPATRRPWRAPG